MTRLMGIPVLAALLLCGCGPKTRQENVIRVWCHQGQEAENQVMRDLADQFNAAQGSNGCRVDIEFFPDYQYSEKIATAAAASDMPDVLDLDGPTLAQLVDAGLLQPLDRWFPPKTREDFLGTIIEQGTIDGQLYALGSFDSALVLYCDEGLLMKAGVALPEEPGWTWDEFLAVCERIKQAGMDPVAMHMNESADEWYTYAFSPVVWSAGGSLIEGDQVEGVMNAPANVRALQQWQEIFNRDLASRNPVDPDPFGNGKTVMDWNGHWMARSHEAQKEQALRVLPLPRTGEHPVSGCGSWCWGLTKDARNADQAATWIQWVTDGNRGIIPIVKANGAIPARKSVLEKLPAFQQTPYKELKRCLEQWGRPRPKTPYYGVLTQNFAAALRDIANGMDVQQRLDQAASQVQQVIDRSRR